MIDFDEIRKDIAIRHNVLLDKDDPVLVTVTLNDIILNSYVEAVSKRYEAANLELTANLQRQVEQSRETAGKIITDAADYVSEQVKKAVREALKEAANDLNRRENLETGKTVRKTDTTTKIAVFSAAVACIASLTALIMAAAVFFR